MNEYLAQQIMIMITLSFSNVKGLSALSPRKFKNGSGYLSYFLFFLIILFLNSETRKNYCSTFSHYLCDPCIYILYLTSHLTQSPQ
jgi:hypothetical protein